MNTAVLLAQEKLSASAGVTKPVSLFQRLPAKSIITAPDFESFRWQESTFVLLNLLVLVILLCGSTLLESHFGRPSAALVTTLGIGIIVQLGELTWLQRKPPALGPAGILLITWGAILFNCALAILLSAFMDRKDSPHLALLVIPVLLAALRMRFLGMLAVIFLASAVNFYCVWQYGQLHPPLDRSELFEAGTMMFIFLVMGTLVWLLLDYLRRNEERLMETHDRLTAEERLAAVGRFSAAIAHEIRNPVAMISSSLMTATSGSLDATQREEMFEIAAREAVRLERLTGDFLAYARPRVCSLEPCNVDDLVNYVADICRAHASQREVQVRVSSPGELHAMIDAPQVQQAILNLAMNAIDASAREGEVRITAKEEDGKLHISVENGNGPIPTNTVDRIFEPFFTTKRNGTGLGLAIAHNIAQSGKGTLKLTRNTREQVCFTVLLPLFKPDTSGG